jgi:hypothetical protein
VRLCQAPENLWRTEIFNLALSSGGDVSRARLDGPDGLPIAGVFLCSLDDFLATGEWIMGEQAAMKLDIERGLATAGLGAGGVCDNDPF